MNFTPEQILSEPAGLKLDSWVAEYIMGFERHNPDFEYTFKAPIIFHYQSPKPCLPPDYSTNIQDAFTVVDKIKLDRQFRADGGTRDFAVHYGYIWSEGKCMWEVGYFNLDYDNCFDISAKADTAPLAICRFAILNYWNELVSKSINKINEL